VAHRRLDCGRIGGDDHVCFHPQKLTYKLGQAIRLAFCVSILDPQVGSFGEPGFPQTLLHALVPWLTGPVGCESYEHNSLGLLYRDGARRR
jgi:hypothetical protein